MKRATVMLDDGPWGENTAWALTQAPYGKALDPMIAECVRVERECVQAAKSRLAKEVDA